MWLEKTFVKPVSPQQDVQPVVRNLWRWTIRQLKEPTLSTSENHVNKPSYTLWQMVLYMLRLGALGFGGPVALVGYMHRDLVENRRWISEADYKEGLALAQLAPGPLAAQLGIYMGYVDYRIVGATLAGLAFVLPSFLMVTPIICMPI
jgi:chromate transporter